MRILAFSDPHGSKAQLAKVAQKAGFADLIICAGDLTSFGNRLGSILKDLSALGKPVLMIPGNHEEHLELKEECKLFPAIKEIDRDFHEQGGILFIGYGGGGFSHETPQFESFARKIRNRSAQHKGKRVVIFHQPPYGTACDLMPYGHVGNETFAAFIAQDQPDLVLCGHIHECFHTQDTMGRTRIMNPGPDGTIIEI
jgi:uncharacterized protein